eukprot:CAMPEP_0183338700 /NCGR_PEP_ID=MMETSP0164_2-20130417/5899_1 /TAXON_ID=221442 /ORGANISM="Coccolithus pelagicus ssp braarudi, Strain PLY182g" /LENGTH=269 /DNA_ID=CAMNT_0025508587 /DNA_START=6 /DNA_END=815 /DNA_ORIENTATION=+
MPALTLFLIRHGDRWDYANKEAWASRCAAHGHVVEDPPLSALGHRQAREVAAALSGEQVSAILVSPYARVLQTAQPLAHALALPMYVEPALAELGHLPQKIVDAAARVPFFPEVDETYRPIQGGIVTDGATGKEPRLEYLRRILTLAEALSERFPGQTIAAFSHAASVALVAALTKSPSLCAAGTFAPCGIYKLVLSDDGAWHVESRGDDNSAHISRNSPTTFPWGWQHIRHASSDEVEALWARALALGASEAPVAQAADATCAADRDT